MYIKNLIYHRNVLLSLLGKSKFGITTTNFIKFDEERMEWWTSPIVISVGEISTIEYAISIINKRNREKKLLSL